MQVGRLVPKADSRQLFAGSSIGVVPETPGCYALVTHDKIVVYIGQANDINRRMQEHLACDEKRSRTPWGYARWLYYRLCDVSDLSQLESEWTRQFKLASRGRRPHFNKHEPPHM